MFWWNNLDKEWKVNSVNTWQYPYVKKKVESKLVHEVAFTKKNERVTEHPGNPG